MKDIPKAFEISMHASLELPQLWSFRRCPYAIRARLALQFANVPVNVTEVSLKNKPEQMLSLSPKGTVPVMLLPDGRVIDESLQIMQWAAHNRAQGTNECLNWRLSEQMEALVAENDHDFKPLLDKYKYADRHPESEEFYRERASEFCWILNKKIGGQTFLFGETPSLADMAIFPFIRQFAGVNATWFERQDWVSLIEWRFFWLESPDFAEVMRKTS